MGRCKGAGEPARSRSDHAITTLLRCPGRKPQTKEATMMKSFPERSVHVRPLPDQTQAFLDYDDDDDEADYDDDEGEGIVLARYSHCIPSSGVKSPD
jgi:hypothetical protein